MTNMGQSGKVLDADHIPIERHWGLSIRLHEALGHSEPWEICDAGCDALASEAILDSVRPATAFIG
jgi:hypothetical protein